MLRSDPKHRISWPELFDFDFGYAGFQNQNVKGSDNSEFDELYMRRSRSHQFNFTPPKTFGSFDTTSTASSRGSSSSRNKQKSRHASPIM